MTQPYYKLAAIVWNYAKRHRNIPQPYCQVICEQIEGIAALVPYKEMLIELNNVNRLSDDQINMLFDVSNALKVHHYLQSDLETTEGAVKID